MPLVLVLRLHLLQSLVAMMQPLDGAYVGGICSPVGLLTNWQPIMSAKLQILMMLKISVDFLFNVCDLLEWVVGLQKKQHQCRLLLLKA